MKVKRTNRITRMNRKRGPGTWRSDGKDRQKRAQGRNDVKETEAIY